MIYSNDRKLTLSGWLFSHGDNMCISPLQLQKFLFFYEAFSKTDGDFTDFSRLKGYIRGPAFSTVLGDYAKNNCEFRNKAIERYQLNKESINEARAQRSRFIVSALTEKELSELTHRYNVWAAKRAQIMAREYQVELSELDFNANDFSITRMLESMYPDDFIQRSTVIPIDDKRFVLTKEDAKKLTSNHLETLLSLSEEEALRNPVYVEIDENGGLCVD